MRSTEPVGLPYSGTKSVRRIANRLKRIDELFAIEREMNGLLPQERLRVRNERCRPLIGALRGLATRISAAFTGCLRWT